MEHSYVGPAFEDAKVRDAMRVGVITCRPETSLSDVARMMVGYDVHSVVVADVDPQRGLWGIVTSLDLARVAGDLGLRDRARRRNHGPDDDPIERAASPSGGDHGGTWNHPSDRPAAGQRRSRWRDLGPRPRRGAGLRPVLTGLAPSGLEDMRLPRQRAQLLHARIEVGELDAPSRPRCPARSPASSQDAGTDRRGPRRRSKRSDRSA